MSKYIYYVKFLKSIFRKRFLTTNEKMHLGIGIPVIIQICMASNDLIRNEMNYFCSFSLSVTACYAKRDSSTSLSTSTR